MSRRRKKNKNKMNEKKQKKKKESGKKSKKKNGSRSKQNSGKGTGKDIVREAQKYKGTRYVYAGDSPKGFDCSGFTWYVYNKVTGMEFQRMALGAPDASGRRRPEPEPHRPAPTDPAPEVE